MVDALFHTFDAHVSLSVISMPIPTWLHSVQQGYVVTPHYLKSSNDWPVTLLWYRIHLGMNFL